MARVKPKSRLEKKNPVSVDREPQSSLSGWESREAQRVYRLLSLCQIGCSPDVILIRGRIVEVKIQFSVGL